MSTPKSDIDKHTHIYSHISENIYKHAHILGFPITLQFFFILTIFSHSVALTYTTFSRPAETGRGRKEDVRVLLPDSSAYARINKGQRIKVKPQRPSHTTQ